MRNVGFRVELTAPGRASLSGRSVSNITALSDAMARPESSVLTLRDLAQARLHAELTFVTKDDLQGVDCSIENVLAATDFVIPALEILSMQNGATTAGMYVVGGCACDPRDTDLRTLGIVVDKNGEIAGMGAGAAVLGHPAQAVIELVRHLAARGQELPAGSLVMSGGITDAIPVMAGDVVAARFQGLGSVSIRLA